MTTYVVLLTGDENRWAQASPEEQAEVLDRHREFSAALEERGHTITGGAELTPSSQTRLVRKVDGQVQVTQGPYLETVEQLGGFYSVESDDLEDLLECCALLADAEGLEVRAALPDPDGEPPA